MSTTILVIESEPWLGDHYQKTLEQNGFSVVRASNAYTAIDLVDESKPAVIVLSLLLHGPGSIGLLHELQSYTDTAVIPVIVCTSHPNANADELEHYGVRQVLDMTAMKPDDLANAVRSVMHEVDGEDRA